MERQAPSSKPQGDSPEGRPQETRKAYRLPQLTRLGSVADLTLGGNGSHSDGGNIIVPTHS